MKSRLFTAVLVTAAFAFAGCGKSAAPSEQAAHTTTTVAPLPATPAGAPVLDITKQNAAAPIPVDFNTLNAMATKTYTVMEPFEKKNIAFKGLELWTLLQAAGVPANATNVHITALDDYQVDLSVADLRKGGVILATQADGSTIAVDHGGPSRIVFLDGVAAGSNPDQWIWSVSHIVVS